MDNNDELTLNNFFNDIFEIIADDDSITNADTNSENVQLAETERTTNADTNPENIQLAETDRTASSMTNQPISIAERDVSIATLPTQSKLR